MLSYQKFHFLKDKIMTVLISLLFCRLKSDQEEYIDKRGIHVVVGHYTGDDNNPSNAYNLTDGKECNKCY